MNQAQTHAPLVAPATIEDFMAQAIAMEFEAVERYQELADAMETHNNSEVAALFRKMSVIESKHADQMLAEMGWSEIPPGTRAQPWEGFESAEVVPMDDVHYLMTPWHALQLALKAEQRAVRFFDAMVEAATTEPVRKAAQELLDEEREHVDLILNWLKKVPKPDTDWYEDPDPPRYDA